jgi:rod shape-determining protein MreC
MRNIISLFIRYSAFIVFLTLECFSFYLIINYNKSQKEIWANSSNLFTGSVNSYIQGVEDFFELQNRNDSLLIENAQLLETIINFRINSKDNNFQAFEDSDSTSNYKLIPSRVCSKTINLRNNYMTLCKGSQDSIKVGMGVLTEDGIAGIISQVSSDFSTVLMILNSESRTSVKVKSKNYFGNLLWRKGSPLVMTLTDIPKHAEIIVGDTVVTSGYSISFPEDIYIGTISDYSLKDGSNSYNIDVDLSTDFSKTDYVYVVSYKLADQKEELLDTDE